MVERRPGATPGILLSTFVKGWPRPKGSLKGQMTRGGGGRLTGSVRMVESNPESTVWLRTMAKAFEATRNGAVVVPYEGPVAVQADFWFDRHAFGAETLASSHPIHPHIGDLDKLVRNLLDALQASKIIKDDRQVVELADTRKRWAPETGIVSGVGVTVWTVTP